MFATQLLQPATFVAMLVPSQQFALIELLRQAPMLIQLGRMRLFEVHLLWGPQSPQAVPILEKLAALYDLVGEHQQAELLMRRVDMLEVDLASMQKQRRGMGFMASLN